MGLDEKTCYIAADDEESDALVCPVNKGKIYFGDELMNRGLTFMNNKDYSTAILIFTKNN